MRPAAPSAVLRRQASVAFFFAAWCAVYGLPADLARNLTAQTAGLSQSAAKPAQQARVLLGRFSQQAQRSEQARIQFLNALIVVPERGNIPAPSRVARQVAPAAFPPVANTDPVLFQRPPPSLFFS